MRVNATERYSRHRGDRGAVLVIVAVFMIVAALFMAFVVDLGNQREDRRQLTTGTDAPAIAVAHEWAAKGGDPTFDCGTSPTADALARDNNPRQGELPTSYECRFDDVTPFRGGVVTVQSGETVDYSFDGFTGVPAGSVGSLTRVRVQPRIGGGARPVALCIGDVVGDVTDPEDSIEAQLADASWTQVDPIADGIWRAPAGDSTVTLTNATGQGGSTNPCRTEGNWNAVLFRQSNMCPGEPNASGGANAFRPQYFHGSPWDLSVNECVSRLSGIGGFNSGEAGALKGATVWFPVFHSAAGGGAGIYWVQGFVEAEVLDVRGGSGNSISFDLDLKRFITKGDCCLLNDDNLEITLCDVGTITGVKSDASDVVCRPSVSTGNPGDPSVADPCLVGGLTPQPLEIPVDAAGYVAEDRAVFVEVVDAGACESLKLFATTSSSSTEATVLGITGNTFEFAFEVGSRLAVSGTTMPLRVFNDGEFLDGEGSLTTITFVPPPECELQGSPSNQVIDTTSNNGGNQVKTADAVTVIVEVPNPSACGTISVTARIGSNDVALAGTGPAATSMTFSLPVNAPLPNGSGNDTTFTMTLRDDTVGRGNQPTFTTRHLAPVAP